MIKQSFNKMVPIQTGKKTLSILMVLTLLISPGLSLASEEAPQNLFNLPQETHEIILEGMEALFNFEFERSIALFSSIQDQREEHPMVAFALASAHWWRLSIFVLEPDQEESRPFLEAVEEAIEAAETKIDKGDPKGEGHLALGGALGLWGRWEATNRNWLSAYFKGKKAIKILRKGVEENPKLYDAYMGLGMFDYFVATLPAVVRVLAFLGASGDKEKGIQELHEAAEKSAYARVPATLFLIDIYANMEAQPEKALQMAREVRKEFPNSPIINLLQAISLYNNDQIEELDECSAHFVKNVETGVYPSVAKTEAYWARGAYFLKIGEWSKAVKFFNKGIALKSEFDAYYVFCHLFKGYALDAQGKRKEAKKQYEIVLEEQRRWNSHDHAKTYLKDPFTKDDPQLKKLKL